MFFSNQISLISITYHSSDSTYSEFFTITGFLHLSCFSQNSQNDISAASIAKSLNIVLDCVERALKQLLDVYGGK